MNELSDMLLVAAGKNFDDGWMQLLIPVIIVIVYAVGGILKMRSNMKEQQEDKGPEAKPRYKPLNDTGWTSTARKEVAAPEMSPAQRRGADQRIERELAPSVRRQPQPARSPNVGRVTKPEERKTLENFLETVAPKPLAVKIAEERAKAQARPKPQQPQWPRSSKRRQAAQKRKPKVAPKGAGKAAPVRLEAPELISPTLSLGEKLSQAAELRNAIIYSEIIGKPIALRDM
jgi:hypothetical protein